MPPDPLAACAFGARNFPRLILKSGYGPESYVDLDLFARTNICRKYLINPFAPEPPVTARADPGPFYPL